MAQKDKKNRTCECCDKTLATPQKLRQHYSSIKNQCSLPSENINQRRVCTPKVVRPQSQIPVPNPVRSKSPAPIVHVRGKDRRKEKPQVIIPAFVPEPEEAPVLGRDYITEEEAKRWVNPNARNPGEHYKTWG